ncbi:MAG: T9SS type A sorting domain-containing protein [Flavobacteriales bacterium]|nr:T9SS type A sorting domain-containing protein [Flavobacteriales bacterium]
MMKSSLSIVLGVLSLVAYGQNARIVLNNDPYIVYDRTAPATQETWLVIGSSTNNAISSNPAGSGNIISERERNFIRWNIGNTTGNYVIPFTSPNNVKMPLNYNKATAGTGGGSVVFSTYNFGSTGAAWNNFLYMPSDVTHMNDLTTGLPNNSDNVVDRFWIIDTQHPGMAYATKPDASLLFTYDAQDVTAGNAINGLSPLNAQRFNTGLQKWGDFLPACLWTNIGGQQRTVSLPAGPGVIGGADFFRSWTLSDLGNPLPVELVSLKGDCENGRVVIRWSTASEQNNDFFLVEKSMDNVEWNTIGTVDGAGNSAGLLNYAFVDDASNTLAYYRLVQTDFDGTTSVSDVVASGCNTQGGISIVSAWDAGDVLNVMVSSSDEQVRDLSVMDAQGKVLITQASQVILNGLTQLQVPKQGISSGIYVIQLLNSSGVLSRRVMLN